jgi:hypothetical protein
MGQGDDGAPPASTGGKLLKLSGEISVLCAISSPCALARHTTQPWTALTHLAADPFACALVASGAHTGPTRQVRCARELMAIGSHLRNETPGSHTIHSGTCHPTSQCLCQLQVLLPVSPRQNSCAAFRQGSCLRKKANAVRRHSRGLQTHDRPTAL